MTDSKLYTSAAIGLAVAAGLGFAVARMTSPDAPVPEAVAEAPSAPSDSVVITPDGILTSDIVVAPAAAGNVDATIAASATVQASPDAEAVLTARAAGSVTRIFKRIGDPVRAGETIALVQSRDVGTINADRSAAAARVTLAQRQVARERTLLAQGVSPRADYEIAEANLAVSRAEAQRAAAAATAAGVAGDGRSVSVVSPISGRITAAAGRLGAFVAAETELFRVADPRSIQISASLPQADAVRVRDGDRVELIIADGEIVEGRVRSATGVIDPATRQATVIITPSAGTSTLAPGQRIRARIFASGDGARSGVSVPRDAVQTLADRSVVFVRTPQGFRARTVRLGGTNGDMVEIASGLDAGTPIATVNAFLLKAELGKDEE